MDLTDILANAGQLQQRVNSANEELEKINIKGVSKSGDCIITLSGKYDVLSLEISDDLFKGTKEKVINTIMETFTDAKIKVDTTVDKVMSNATAGVPLPDFS